MSIMEKMQEAVGVTPTYTNQEREEIRAKAKSQATAKWFTMVLDHHKQIEAAFAALKQTKTVAERKAAQEKLATLLTGHSIAEEVIVYPFMKIDTSSMDAKHAYEEQSMAKMELVALDEIPNKISKEYDEKLEEIRLAVTHHMVEEERDFFPELQEKADAEENRKITQHYEAEFNRYLPALKAA